jgi:hypothetical protein
MDDYSWNEKIARERLVEDLAENDIMASWPGLAEYKRDVLLKNARLETALAALNTKTLLQREEHFTKALLERVTSLERVLNHTFAVVVVTFLLLLWLT